VGVRLSEGHQQAGETLYVREGPILSGNTNKMQLVVQFIIPKFIESLTCFEQHTAHHQEL